MDLRKVSEVFYIDEDAVSIKAEKLDSWARFSEMWNSVKDKKMWQISDSQKKWIQDVEERLTKESWG